MNLCAALLSSSGLFEVADGNSLRIRLFPNKPVAPNFEIELMRKPVYYADTHAMQATRDFVRRRIELAAGMQNRQHHLGSG